MWGSRSVVELKIPQWAPTSSSGCSPDPHGWGWMDQLTHVRRSTRVHNQRGCPEAPGHLLHQARLGGRCATPRTAPCVPLAGALVVLWCDDTGVGAG